MTKLWSETEMTGASKLVSGKTLHPVFLRIHSDVPTEPGTTALWVHKAKLTASYGSLGDSGRSLCLPEYLAYARY